MQINEETSIDDDELTFIASRSAGPGGQNVNKVATRVTLRFDLAGSPSLEPEQKERIGERLATRINKEGVLQVSSQRHRTQSANREAAREKFVELLREALVTRAKRRQSRVPRRVDRRRLDEKRKRSRLKEGRSRDYSRDD